MKTNCFELQPDDPNTVAISRTIPDYYSGRWEPDLAPSPRLLNFYKRTGNVEMFTFRYEKEVLNKLNPAEVYARLGSNAILLCWELPGKFCHRRLLAEWLEDYLKIKIPEVEA